MDAKRRAATACHDELTLRAGKRGLALRMVDEHLDIGCVPGFYGQVVLILQDGIVETVRFERSDKVPRLNQAA